MQSNFITFITLVTAFAGESGGQVKNFYLHLFPDMVLFSPPGDVAQLEERDNRTVEVRGSSPLISTIYYKVSIQNLSEEFKTL